MQSEVHYLGYRINADGLHTTEEKVKAIRDAPQPQNQQLRSFLGLVNYYGKFIPGLSTTTQLLRHKVRWEWSKDCQKAFQKLNEQLISRPVLVHYDSSLPL